MKILHRLPGYRWNPDCTITIEELWSDAFPKNYTFVVGSIEAFDYLQAMALMRGEPLKVAFDPQFSLLHTNVVELLIQF